MGRVSPLKSRCSVHNIPYAVTATWTATRPDTLTACKEVATLLRRKQKAAAILISIDTQSYFVGRQRELATAQREIDLARQGHTRILAVSGEAGIGKTRFLRHVARQVGDGAVVLQGGAGEEEGMPPLLPFLEAIGDYIRRADVGEVQRQAGPDAATLAPFFPELAVKLPALDPGYPLPPDQARLRLFQAVGRFLANVSGDRVGIVLLDDLQWADPSTLDLLRHIPRHQPDAPLLLIVAFRADGPECNLPLQRTLVDLIRRRVLTQITLGPLSADEIGLLVTCNLELPPSSSLQELLVERSEGNPFFAEELLRMWRDDEALLSESGYWRLSHRSDQVPATIVSAVQQRLRHLPDATVQLLQVASVLGRRFDLSLLSRLAKMDLESAENTLRAAVAAHLLGVDQGRTYRFLHDTIRECVCGQVGAVRRSHLHAAIATELERQMAEAGDVALADLAFHALRGGDSEKGFRFAVAAADQAMASLAPHEAVALYAAALERLAADDSRRGDLWLSQGEALLQAGRGREAVVAFENALMVFSHRQDRRSVARAAHGLGIAWWRLGELSRAQVTLEGAVVQTGDQRTPDAVRQLVDLATLLNFHAGRQDDGLASARRALNLAQRLDDPRLEAAARRALGQLTVWSNRIEEGIRELESALALAVSAGDPAEAAEICGVLANAYVATVDLERSEQITYRRLEYAERSGQPYALRHVHLWLAELAMQRGQWDQAERLLTQAQELFSRLDEGEPVAVAHRVRGRIAYYRGDYALAALHFTQAWDIVRGQGAQHAAWYAGQLALAHCAAGNTGQAKVAMAQLETAILDLPPGSLSTAPAWCDLLELRLALGDASGAARAAEKLRPFSGRLFLTLVDLILGRYELRIGDPLQGVEYLTAAERQCRNAGLRPLLVAVLESRAGLARADVRRSTEAADEASALRVELAMGALPVPAVGHIGRPRPSYPGGLSHREVDVLRLVAIGKSNRQIANELNLSEKTVENHVTSIFNKVGCDNRAAAAAFAVRSGLA